ncbi:MAG: hypothetical protein JWP44_367 [Mucilaginibacter sp.]|nr:hypothetical protein [Mucilaginibacter sp.]
MVSDTDAQSITMLAGSLSAVMVAIPLFLKDFNNGSAFGKQFYVIAFMFIICSAAGVFCFLDINEKAPLNVDIWFFLAALISVNSNTIAILYNLFSKRHFDLSFSISPGITGIFSFGSLLTGVLLAPKNQLLSFFILVTIYGLYLTILLMTSVLFQMLQPTSQAPTSSLTDINHDLQVKKAIELTAIKHKSRTLDEQELINELRRVCFPEMPQIINATILEMLVSEMDVETDPNQPMVKIVGSYEGPIIPRWYPVFSDLVKFTEPSYIGMILDETSYGEEDSYKRLLSWDELKKEKKLIDEIYDLLAKNTGLSKPLLEDNDAITDKYQIVAFIYRKPDYSSFSEGGVLLVDKNQVSKLQHIIGEITEEQVSLYQLRILLQTMGANDFYRNSNLRKSAFR